MKIKRILAGALAALMTAGLLTGCGGTQQTAEQPAATPEPTAEPQADFAGTQAAPAQKEETVYVYTDACGNTDKITVETVLTPGASGEIIADESNLTDIRNTEGDEEYTQNGSELLWENHGENITYEGTGSGELPVSVKVTYYLNDTEIAPEDLAGQSGRVRVRFDYENNTACTVEVDGEEVETVVPFVAMSMAMLDGDVFSNIECENGDIIDLAGQQVFVGFALPGLADTLALQDYDLTDELDLPGYAEFTADVEDFALDFTATVVTAGLFDDMEDDDLADADDAMDSMDELEDATEDLTEGTDELYSGVATFYTYLQTYLSGIGTVQQSVAALDEALTEMDGSTSELTAGTAALSSGLAAVNAVIADFNAGGDDTDLTALGTAAAALSQDAAAMTEELAAMQTQLAQLQSFTGDASAYTDSVTEAVSAAQTALSGIDYSAADSSATAQARAQASAAVTTALQGSGLDDAAIAAAAAQTAAGISLSGLTADISAAVSSAQTALGGIGTLEVPDVSLDTTALSGTIEDMQTQLGVISANADVLAGLGDSMTALQGAVASLQTSLAQLGALASAIDTGMAAFGDAVTQLSEGVSALNTGMTELNTAGVSLGTGYLELQSGVQSLRDGIEEYAEEGIYELTDLAQEDVAYVLQHIKALREADGLYTTYAGLPEGTEGTVRFIIETDEIA